ncbi:MAG: hypothetical protein LDL33_11910 [Desulfomonile sp.]|nr:hypothetical protein [Desulfomonile sp.]
MDLETLLKSKDREDDELSDDNAPGLDADEEDAASEPNGPAQPKSREESLSREELIAEYRRLSDALVHKAAEVEDLTGRLGQPGASVPGGMSNPAQEDALMLEFQEAFRSDPARAVLLLVSKAKSDTLQQVEAGVMRLMKEQKHFTRAMEQFFGDPANAHLKPFREELEFLIDEMNFPPGLAAAFVQTIARRHDEAAAKRSAAARAVRNRAAVENDGEVGEPADRDRDLNRVLKKSRTLEEMFAGLSKIRM